MATKQASFSRGDGASAFAPTQLRRDRLSGGICTWRLYSKPVPAGFRRLAAPT